MKQEELYALNKSKLPSYKYYTTYLEWIMIRITQARQQGMIEGSGTGSDGLDYMLLHKICDVRGMTSAIKYQLSARMPLPYTHFVQLLVDTFLFSAPFALIPELGILSIPCTGLLTLFYGGLLDLAKVFLDPLDNEDYADTDTDMDLIVLTNEISNDTNTWELSGTILPWTIDSCDKSTTSAASTTPKKTRSFGYS